MIAVMDFEVWAAQAPVLALADVSGIPQPLLLVGAVVVVLAAVAVTLFSLPAVRTRRHRRSELRRFRRQAALDYQRPSLGQAGLSRLAAVDSGPVRTVPEATLAPAPEQAGYPEPQPWQHPSASPVIESDEPVMVETPPPGYVPLEIPELWEPEPHAPTPQHASWQQHVPTPAPQPTFVQPQPAHNLPQPVQAAPPRGRRAPRTIQELRADSFATKPYANMRELAVGAVLEGGYDSVGIARLFRFPHPKLLEWVAQAVRAGSAPGANGRTR